MNFQPQSFLKLKRERTITKLINPLISISILILLFLCLVGIRQIQDKISYHLDNAEVLICGERIDMSEFVK